MLTLKETIADTKDRWQGRFIYHRDREDYLFTDGNDEESRKAHDSLTSLARFIADNYDGNSFGMCHRHIEMYVQINDTLRNNNRT